ncbi:MAG: ABC transporter permease [Planctomycetes bacterium]|nr:ABC transporter permease [Planctomycetota bacterium]
MKAWEITFKDLKLLARDRRAAFVLVAFPLIFIAILGLSFGQLQERRIGPESPSEETQADQQKSESDREKSDAYRQLVPGFTVMFVFFLVNIMARSFIHERQLGTLNRLRIAPLSPSSLLIGKTAPFFIISLIQTAVLFLAGRFVWGMTWGTQPWLLLPVIVTTSLSATALGLLVATLVRTDSQVSAYANVVVITMAGVSGCFVPRDWLPETMQLLSRATPHAWALIGYHEILTKEAPSLGVVTQSCGMLLGFSLLFFLLGCLRFSRVE